MFSDFKTKRMAAAAIRDGAVCMVVGAIDSTGTFFPLESCTLEEYENADGTIAYVDATFGTDKWRQTYTYGASPKRTTSQWVKQ